MNVLNLVEATTSAESTRYTEQKIIKIYTYMNENENRILYEIMKEDVFFRAAVVLNRVNIKCCVYLIYQTHRLKERKKDKFENLSYSF
jgi:hypothetical protein